MRTINVSCRSAHVATPDYATKDILCTHNLLLYENTIDMQCSKDTAVNEVMVMSHLEANFIPGTRFCLDVTCQRIVLVLFISVAIFFKFSPTAKNLDIKVRTIWKEHHCQFHFVEGRLSAAQRTLEATLI